MSIIDQKKNIFGNIGALNALNDNYPKLPSFNSFESINNRNNSTNFLLDLITSLVGFNALKTFLIDTVVYQLPKLESDIKDSLKLNLNEIVSCSVNPSIPTWLQHGNSGIVLETSNIDFFDIMKINPTTLSGGLIFTDVAAGVNSTDFNTYLSNTIQTPGSPTLWGSSTTLTNIIETSFLEVGTTQNNVLKFTTSPQFSNKKLIEFNNALVDSISLFGGPDTISSATFTNKLIEELFGSISSSSTVNKSKKQLKKEAEIREVLDAIINSENDVIDNSFFNFDNPTLARIEEEVNNRKNGIRRLSTCGDLIVSVTSDELNINQNIILSSTTKQEEFLAVSQVLDNLAEIQGGATSSTQDRLTIRNDFFKNMIQKLVGVVANSLMSPSFVTVFAINHAIIYGETETYDDPIDFLKKNKNVIKALVRTINTIIIGLLLKLALKELTTKLRQKISDDESERIKSYNNILLSYVGVSPSITNNIINL
jgi:hypothetical protein